jgi:hypothetical protein
MAELLVGVAGRIIRAVRIAGTDKRIPTPLRSLAVIGIAPIPGPIDEALLLIVALPLVLFYRASLAEAWRRAGKENPAGAGLSLRLRG